MSSATSAKTNPDLRGASGDAGAGSAATAGAGALAAAGRATLGVGGGVGCAGAAGRDTGADAAGGALVGAGVHAGADAVTNTMPQWTQNFAPGWFSLPHAEHFIDRSSDGNLDRALTWALRMKCGRLCATRASLIMTPSSFGCHFTGKLKHLACGPHGRSAASPSLQPPLDATIEYVHRALLGAMSHSR
jgi:hypothetical protein